MPSTPRCPAAPGPRGSSSGEHGNGGRKCRQPRVTATAQQRRGGFNHPGRLLLNMSTAASGETGLSMGRLTPRAASAVMLVASSSSDGASPTWTLRRQQ